jgi:segregation and condensation protein B
MERTVRVAAQRRHGLRMRSKSLDNPTLECLIEALLFVAEGPVSVEDLAKALESDIESVVPALQRLAESCAERGVRVVRAGTRAQLVTSPAASAAIERYLGVSAAGKLSAAAMETLAIIAYRQPITRAQIDATRGVNSDGVLRTLLAKALIASVGRMEQAGRPLLYGTTFEFMQYFGIQSLAELPTLPELNDYAAEAPQTPPAEQPSSPPEG